MIRTLAPTDDNGKMAVTVTVLGSDESVNSLLISEGLARVGKPTSIESLASRMATACTITVTKLGNDLSVAEQVARKSRCGMWRYGDIGDEDPDEL